MQDHNVTRNEVATLVLYGVAIVLVCMCVVVLSLFSNLF
jgi:hypothetical protein